jgi:hypothetical protein
VPPMPISRRLTGIAGTPTEFDSLGVYRVTPCCRSSQSRNSAILVSELAAISAVRMPCVIFAFLMPFLVSVW